MQVQLHLERGMPLFEREHGAPVEPEIAGEKIVAHHFIDAFGLHFLARGEKEPQQILLGLFVQCQKGLVGDVLSLHLSAAL